MARVRSGSAWSASPMLAMKTEKVPRAPFASNLCMSGRGGRPNAWTVASPWVSSGHPPAISRFTGAKSGLSLLLSYLSMPFESDSWRLASVLMDWRM